MGGHHVLVHPNDPTRTVTVPVHGSHDLKPGTLRAIVRQARLTIEEFVSFFKAGDSTVASVCRY